MNTQPGIQTFFPWYEGQPTLQAIEQMPERICHECGGTAYVTSSDICADCLDPFTSIN